MPVETSHLEKPDSKIAYYDPREHAIDNKDPNTMVGYNGHVELLFQADNLTIEYHDILNSKVLFSETFTPNSDGTLKYSFSKPTDSPLSSGQQINFSTAALVNAEAAVGVHRGKLGQKMKDFVAEHRVPLSLAATALAIAVGLTMYRFRCSKTR